MQKSILFKTNLLVCIIIVIGFVTTSIISYQSNIEVAQTDIEMVSHLSLDGLYREITNVFAQPVSVGLTMANDTLLKDFIIAEGHNQADAAWQEQMQEYLTAYRIKYGYHSVFLISTATNNYYHFDGFNRELTTDNEENTWYYDFIEQDQDYSINVDNDEATDNSIMVFINCRIKDENNVTLGIVGVGVHINTLHSLLKRYADSYGVDAYLIDNKGKKTVALEQTERDYPIFFQEVGYEERKKEILQDRDSGEHFWYKAAMGERYIVSQYEPNLKWHLIIEKDTTVAQEELNMQLLRNLMVIIIIIILVMIIITSVIKRYNNQITQLTISQELDYQRMLHEMTMGLYDDVFELDITNNCAGGESTRRYFESLGLRGDASYDCARNMIASKQIKKEYMQGYLDAFSPQAVLEAYKNGITSLTYDFMISTDGMDFHWYRIVARIFFWNSDKSIRMITYRKNIDAEKRRELALLEGLQKDPMTGLYNKRATEDLVREVLSQEQLQPPFYHAFLIFDIDNFKMVNDTMGHSFGDLVINEVAAEIKQQFRKSDIVGRIGGDEFAALMIEVNSKEWLVNKMEELCNKMKKKEFGKEQVVSISCSIGIALFPQDGASYAQMYENADQALYCAKSRGKNSFAFFEECQLNGRK